MKVLILGSDKISHTLAERLEHDHNEITLIDNNFESLEKIKQKLDVKVIKGLPSSPEVLKNAGIAHMDMILAMVMNDEVNILACQLASRFSDNEKLVKIARIHGHDYLKNENILHDFSINEIINPETLVSEYLENLIKNPGISQIIKFIHSLVHLFAFKVEIGSQIDGRKTQEIHDFIKGVPIHIPIIFRNNKYLLPKAETVIKADDEVYFITPNSVNPDDISRYVLNEPNIYKNIIIVGGGHIGLHLALNLEHSHNIFLIEKDKNRCDAIVDSFTGSTILLQGSAEDQNILAEANVSNCDLFFASSNYDEINILSCVIAKNMGAGHTTCLVNDHNLVPVAENNTKIDLALSPDRITIGHVLKYMRKNHAIAVYPMRKGYSELIEIEVNKNNNFFALNNIVDEIKLPNSVQLTAIIRKGKMLEPHGQTVIEKSDHLILIVADSEVMTDLNAMLSKN